MIKPLRKMHLQIWLLLAVLLPAGIIIAWLSVPAPVKDHLLQPLPTVALPLTIKNIIQRNYSVSIRCNADTSALQLEWINNETLTAPPALIYQINDEQKNIEDGGIIGRIDRKGIFRFPLKKDAHNNHFHFVLYDIIHHQVIDRINF